MNSNRVEFTEEGEPYIMMPSSNNATCVSCGGRKSKKPFYAPVRMGTLDSFVRRSDGSIAKLDKETCKGTGKGGSMLFVYPLDVCKRNACIDKAFAELKETTPTINWQPSLFQCATCKQSPSNLMRCSGCMLVSYCSRDCQKKDWKAHKLFCKK
jgi:hypothetical protein